ncbi:tail fiber domain-containing protein, partial [bacterium]|nr:tail fiber domain-containing protein [bacterium]
TNVVGFSTGGAEKLRIDASGNVGIGSTSPGYKLDVVGDIRITGTPYRAGGDIAWTVPSDARLKDVTGPFDHGLSDLVQLDIIRFRYKENNPVGADTSKEYTGVLAQDVQKVIPEAVNQDKTGFLSLNTTPIFWSMINAIKELYSKFMGQEVQLAAQGREIASVKAETAQKADKAEMEAQLKAKDQKIKELEQKLKQQEADTKARLDKIEKLLKSK